MLLWYAIGQRRDAWSVARQTAQTWAAIRGVEKKKKTWCRVTLANGFQPHTELVQSVIEAKAGVKCYIAKCCSMIPMILKRQAIESAGITRRVSAPSVRNK